MRSWIGAIVSLADVVMMVHECSGCSAWRLGAAPRLPQPGEGQRLAVEAVDEVRLLALLARPLVCHS